MWRLGPTSSGYSAIVGLDEPTKQIYRRTDSATLIGLLQELRRLNKGAQKERERLGEQLPHGETEVHDKLLADFAVYVATTTEREIWIRTELKRRGLLPLWPGEEHHLDDDA
jgi:hypothetical protein